MTTTKLLGWSVVGMGLLALGGCANAIDDVAPGPQAANPPGQQWAPQPEQGDYGNVVTATQTPTPDPGTEPTPEPEPEPEQPPTGPTPKPVSGLSAYFDFETTSGGVFDMSGNGNVGATAGTGVSFLPGKFGTAASFSGFDGRIVVPASKSLDFASAATIEFWIRLNGVSSGSILSRGIGSGDNSVRVRTTQGNLQVTFARAGGASAMLMSDPGVLGSAWTHVAIVNDGVEMRLYVDGSLKQTATGGALGALYSALHIGKSEAADSAFNGMIDDVKWWTVARSTQEICEDAGGVFASESCTLP